MILHHENFVVIHYLPTEDHHIITSKELIQLRGLIWLNNSTLGEGALLRSWHHEQSF